MPCVIEEGYDDVEPSDKIRNGKYLEWESSRLSSILLRSMLDVDKWIIIKPHDAMMLLRRSYFVLYFHVHPIYFKRSTNSNNWTIIIFRNQVPHITSIELI